MELSRDMEILVTQNFEVEFSHWRMYTSYMDLSHSVVFLFSCTNAAEIY